MSVQECSNKLVEMRSIYLKQLRRKARLVVNCPCRGSEKWFGIQVEVFD